MDSALKTAEALLKVGKAGLGKDQEATPWHVRSVVPLAALLYAASPSGCCGGIGWVQEAITNADPEDVTNPGWAKAALVCTMRYPAIGQMLLSSIVDLSPAQWDSLKMAMLDAVRPWPTECAAAAPRR